MKKINNFFFDRETGGNAYAGNMEKNVNSAFCTPQKNVKTQIVQIVIDKKTTQEQEKNASDPPLWIEAPGPLFGPVG